MKRIILVGIASILLAIPHVADAQTREPFNWRLYGINKLVPDDYIPTPAGVNAMDKTQIINLLAGAGGYEKGTQKLREGLAGSIFDSVVTPLPDYFWDEVQRQVREGRIERVVIHNGEKAGDRGLVSGSKLDAKGNMLSYIERDYPINQTGGDIYGWKLMDAIQVNAGPFAGTPVNPIIYEFCRNVTAFEGTLRIPVSVQAPIAPEPVTSAATEAIATSAATTKGPDNVNVNINVIDLGEAAKHLTQTRVEVKKGSFCGPAAWRCWVPPLAAGIVICALKCGGSDHDDVDTQVYTTPGKVPQPLPPVGGGRP